MAQHNELGKAGEVAAAEYLKANGFQIRHVNWHKGNWELDIVAQRDDELIFVEVKTRTGAWEAPEDAVNNAKIRRIVSAADGYIKYFDLDLPARFDIIAVIGKGPDFEIDHMRTSLQRPLGHIRDGP
jgi:putative endonuclease